MKKNLIILLFNLWYVGVYAQQERPIGINLTSIEDYSTEFVFTDAFKQSRTWTTANADGTGPWDTQIAIPLLANGFPVEIPYSDGIHPPQKVRSLMSWDLGLATPQGFHRLIVEGSGQVTLNFGANGTFNFQ